MPPQAHLEAAKRIQEEEERKRRGEKSRPTRRGATGPTAPRAGAAGTRAPERGEDDRFRPFQAIGQTIGDLAQGVGDLFRGPAGGTARTAAPARPGAAPERRRAAAAAAPTPGVARPVTAAPARPGASPAGLAAREERRAARTRRPAPRARGVSTAVPGYRPALPAILRGEGGAAGGLTYTTPSAFGPGTAGVGLGAAPGGGTGAVGITGRPAAPAPPAAPAGGGLVMGGAAPTAPAAGAAPAAPAGGPEAEVDWTQLGFGSQGEGENWARAFAAEHGGNMPWEEGTMSAKDNLAEHLAALQWGQSFAEATGRQPGEGDYRAEWFRSRFGLGRNWNIPGAARGGGMGFMPREYMGG
jgi:hypothetical protein